MKSLTLNIPEEANEKEIKMVIASLLFERAFLSSGQAADFAGISKREFIEQVGKYGVSVFGETSADLENSFGK